MHQTGTWKLLIFLENVSMFSYSHPLWKWQTYMLSMNFLKIHYHATCMQTLALKITLAWTPAFTFLESHFFSDQDVTVRPSLLSHHRAARNSWARHYRRQWSSVLFLQHNDGRVLVHRRPRWTSSWFDICEHNVVGGKVLWYGELLRVDWSSWYLDDILRPLVSPRLQRNKSTCGVPGQ